ncbi:hypothetical protein E2C01_035645 [Portunus trituberculatus]|uniref:Uncharacterized protein n=1 Tax=Portunus trituberculatus TaxID=210409 RepID=A0A5B7F6F8_PORTR|nr:hypothetical protein [Portunus trituberculatus]
MKRSKLQYGVERRVSEQCGTERHTANIFKKPVVNCVNGLGRVMMLECGAAAGWRQTFGAVTDSLRSRVHEQVLFLTSNQIPRLD